MPGGGAGELPGAEHETPEAAPGESPAGRVRRTKPRVDVEEAKRQRKAAQRKAAQRKAQKGQEDKHPMMQHLEGLAAKAARATERARRQGMNVPPPITADGDGPWFPAGSKQQRDYEKYLAYFGSSDTGADN